MQSFRTFNQDGLEYRIRVFSDSSSYESSYSSTGEISSLHFDDNNQENYVNECLQDIPPEDECREHLKNLFSDEYRMRDLITAYNIELHKLRRTQVEVVKRINKLQKSWWRKLFSKFKIEMVNLERYLESIKNEIDKTKSLRRQKFLRKQSIQKSIECYFL